MNNIQKRFLLFLIFCIGSRIMIFYISLHINEKYIKYIGLITLIIGIGFAYIFLTDSRKTGGEVFGDKIWWNNLRPVHSVLYILFSFNALVYNKSMSQLLLADVIIGFIFFLNFHYTNDPELLKTLFSTKNI
jgi:hypothetical protein